MKIKGIKTFYILFAIFILAVFLRWIYLPQNAISFAYDQARDAFVAQEIISGNLKLLGPSVSGVPGLAHGVLYYYIIAPLYSLGHGNPQLVAYFLSFVSSLGVFTTFFLVKILTKKNIPSILSALIFAVSFESSQYANLLTNASMGLWFVPLFYITLYFWLTKQYVKWAPLCAGLFLGLSIQAEAALGYHFAPLIFWLFIFRKQISAKEVFIFVFGFLIAISTMILAEFKFGFPGIQGIIYLLSGVDGIAQEKTLTDFISVFINQTGTTFAYNIFPISTIVGGMGVFFAFGFSIIASLKEIKTNILSWQIFLISYVTAHFFGLPFGGSNMRHLMVGAGAGIAAFAGIFIWKYLWKNKVLLGLAILLILTTNIFKILTENKNGQTIFPLQLDLVLSKEIAAVDYTYTNSNKEEFSISTLTSPLYVNTLWSYLYNWYGKGRYNYLPYWIGKDQIGQLGNNLPKKDQHFFLEDHYYIIEPTYGIPELYVTYARGEQESISSLKSENSFGQIKVEERIMNDSKN